MVVTATYDNGTTAAVTDYTVTPDPLTLGITQVTITHAGKTAVQAITVTAKSVVSIAVTTAPAKTAYIEGTAFDKTGMVVTATYDNGDKAAVTGYMVTPDPLTLGTTKVIITYAGKTAEQAVTVSAKTLQSIAVTTAPAKTSFTIGSTFSAAGGVITLTYDNASTAQVNITNAMCSGYNMDSIGSQTVTVTYEGKTTAFNITVQDKELVSISIKTQPSQKTFVEGAAFAVDGVITLHYNNDATEDKNIAAAMCSGYDMNKVGEQTVTITESGKTASYQITVNAKSAVSIVLKTPPEKTVYIEGQDLVLTGAVITASYDNGTTADINVTADMISGYSKNTVGTQTVTVTYQGKTAAFDVTVNAKTLTGIALDASSAVTEYFEGTELDLTGLVLIASYDNGTTANEAVTAAMVSGYDKAVLGDQSVTVSYNGKTAAYTVTVFSRAAVDALISAIDELDIAGLTIEDQDKVFALRDTYDALSDFEQAAVTNKDKLDEAVAKINALLNPEATDQTFLDGKVNIKAEPGVIPAGAVLKVAEASASDDALAAAQAEYGEESLFIGYFAITLEDADGNLIQPNGTLLITIQLDSEYADGKDLVLLYVAEDGTIAEVTAAFEDGYAVFETDHLSEYGIVKMIAADAGDDDDDTTDVSDDDDDTDVGDDDETTVGNGDENTTGGDDTEAPKTGDNSQAEWWITLMLVSVAAIIFLARKRKTLPN